jgi:hypothetical protein
MLFIWIAAGAGVFVTAYFAGAALSTIDLGEYYSSGLIPKPKRMRAFSTAYFLIVGLILISIDREIRNSLGLIWLIAAVVGVIAFVVPGPVLVTPEGLLRTHAFRRDTLIRWDELDHYEISTGTWGVADVYYIRTQDGRTLKINDGSQAGSLLLNKIGQYKKLPQLPFQH